jgi:LacI family transcriptional regulator
MSTIIDVAALAEVSTATVSRVLNKSGYVDPALVARVNGAVEKLKYQPNLVARAFRTQATSVIALVIPDIENQFFTSICRGLEDAANEAGYSVMICNTDEDIEKENDYLAMLASQNVAGIVISPVSSKYTNVQIVLDRNIQIVSVGRSLPIKADSVHVDNRKGGRLATEHLIEGEYKSIACITGDKGTSSAEERLLGYKDALTGADLEIDPRYQIYADFKDQGGYDGAKKLMSLPTPPDAIFTTNNRMTAGAFQALKELKKDIPKNVGLIGFDEIPWGEIVTPSVSTVAQPTRQMGMAAAKKLISRLNDEGSEVEEILFQPELIIRQSSRR